MFFTISSSSFNLEGKKIKTTVQNKAQQYSYDSSNRCILNISY